MSNGFTSVGTATWDPEKQVMTEIRKNAQFTITTTTNWSQKDVESWTMVFKDKSSSKILRKMSGENTKISPSETQKDEK